MNPENQIREFIGRHNQMPLEDFDGFSSYEMATIIHFPFTDECPISLNKEIEIQKLKKIPIFNIALYLMEIILSKGEIKLTPKGNLPTALVKEIYYQKYFLDNMIEAGIAKPHLEENWTILHNTKIVLKMSGLVRVFRGKLITTKQGKSLLENKKYYDIFLCFLKSFTLKFNWAYNDRYDDEVIGQMGFLYLLHLICKYGNEYRNFNYYSDLYFKAYPDLKEAAESSMYDFSNPGESTLESRFVSRFAVWFGLVEIPENQNKGLILRDFEIKKSEILKDLIHLTGGKNV